MLLFVPSLGVCARDADVCHDHPLLNRMQHFYIQECDEKDFDEHGFLLASGDEVMKGPAETGSDWEGSAFSSRL